MTNIAHFLEMVKTLSNQLFIFQTNFEPLTFINNIPDDILNLLYSPELEVLLDEACGSVNRLNSYLDPFLKKIQKITHRIKSDKDIPTGYADFRIDSRPVFRQAEAFEQLDFEDLVRENNITPVRHRTDFEYKGTCPYCGAPSKYLYLNNGAAGRQYLCKCCRNTFSDKVSIRKTSGFYCPHCGRRLSVHHDRRNYLVYLRPSSRCPYYIKNRKLGNEGLDNLLLTSSKMFRYRYHFREFKFNLDEIKNTCIRLESAVNLARIHVEPYVLGLIMTYYINYGLSAGKVSNIMRDVHGVSVSKQTVLNYGKSVAAVVRNMVDNYSYRPSSTLSGDETYVKVSGSYHYVFFFSDPVRKFITSYTVFDKRDTRTACISIQNCLNKYETIPEDLNFIVDGNPIYNASQLFFEMNDICFDLHQVVGIANRDEVSRKYRPVMQVEERLNRTFRLNYYPMNGFKSLDCANAYMTNFVCFFNFLRRHSSLMYRPPVVIRELQEIPLMPDKWLKLIDMATSYN